MRQHPGRHIKHNLCRFYQSPWTLVSSENVCRTSKKQCISKETSFVFLFFSWSGDTVKTTCLSQNWRNDASAGKMLFQDRKGDNLVQRPNRQFAVKAAHASGRYSLSWYSSRATTRKQQAQEHSGNGQNTLGGGKLASEGFFPGRDNNGLFREDHKDISRGRNGVEILFYPFETKRK